MAFYGSLGEVNFGNLDASIADTAVDVFVYDTRKDSDGGAWRNRTQHTSWYNETLNTATRGSRREFPAVAVIVTENDKVTIYDGDDPDLPMWMVFNDGGFNFIFNNLTSCYALNGTLSLTNRDSPTGNWIRGLRTLNFISEIGFSYDANTNTSVDASQYNRKGYYNGLIIDRNASKAFDTTDINIIHHRVNDVAMTVLPNAPIDSATGLPIPTIAVATDGGLSVIKDDGTVTSGGEANSSWQVNKLFIDSNYNIWGSEGSDYSPGIQLLSTLPYSSVADIGTGTLGYQLTTQVTTAYGRNTSWPFILGTYGSEESRHVAGKEYIFNGARHGLTFLQDNTTDRSSSMVAYATTSYNTGWQHGDIKGAFLSDTDATNVTGTELVTNGTFDTDTTGWSVGAGWSINSNKLYHDGTGSRYDQIGIPVIVGKEYTVSATMTLISGTSNTSFQIFMPSSGTLINGAWSLGVSGAYTKQLVVGQTYTHTYTFVATESTISIGGYSEDIFEIDNISVRLADPDRSVNNKGLQVFGTITKSAVATGAELVGYGGNGTANYLEQPYNSDLDFGANTDFSVMGWMYNTNVGGGQLIFDRSVTYDSSRDWQLWVAADLKYMTMYIAGAQATVTPNGSFPNDTWFHFAVVRGGGTIKIYINGVEKSSNSSTVSTIPASNVPMKVLYNCNSNTKLSLLRISASAPSPEQIKKIYEDEKVFFQENAACTLYGSSDAVTALAYDEDTDLLHVGTSSGRSDFQGLRRINNTTTAVTTAISASDGLIVEQ